MTNERFDRIQRQMTVWNMVDIADMSEPQALRDMALEMRKVIGEFLDVVEVTPERRTLGEFLFGRRNG